MIFLFFMVFLTNQNSPKVILKRNSQFSSESPHWILYRPNAFNLSFQSLWNFLVVDVMHGCMVHLLITLFANLPKLSILSHKPHYSKCYLCEQPLRLSFINYLKARKGPLVEPVHLRLIINFDNWYKHFLSFFFFSFFFFWQIKTLLRLF